MKSSSIHYNFERSFVDDTVKITKKFQTLESDIEHLRSAIEALRSASIQTAVSTQLLSFAIRKLSGYHN